MIGRTIDQLTVRLIDPPGIHFARRPRPTKSSIFLFAGNTLAETPLVSESTACYALHEVSHALCHQALFKPQAV